MSKATTQAPRFFSSRLSMAKTSPSTTTMPMSSSSSPMGVGALEMALPKMALPWGFLSFFPGAAGRAVFFRAARRSASVRAKGSAGVWGGTTSARLSSGTASVSDGAPGSSRPTDDSGAGAASIFTLFRP